MNICSDGHDEICYDTYDCPMCKLIDEHIDTIDDLDEKIDDLENTINDLTNLIKQHIPEELI